MGASSLNSQWCRSHFRRLTLLHKLNDSFYASESDLRLKRLTDETVRVFARSFKALFEKLFEVHVARAIQPAENLNVILPVSANDRGST